MGDWKKVMLPWERIGTVFACGCWPLGKLSHVPNGQMSSALLICTCTKDICKNISLCLELGIYGRDVMAWNGTTMFNVSDKLCNIPVTYLSLVGLESIWTLLFWKKKEKKTNEPIWRKQWVVGNINRYFHFLYNALLK